MKKHNPVLAAAVAAFLLAGCGGDPSGWPVPERQFGVNEAQLLDMASNPDGVVVGAGSGLVVLQLEPLGGAPAPLIGDSASLDLKGVDAMWFDVDNPALARIHLPSDAFAVLAQAAVLDEAGAVLLQIDSAHPNGEVQLGHGHYLLRLTAASTAPSGKVSPGMVWWGGVSKLFNATDVQKLASGNCPDCNLRGADLTQTVLRGVNIPGADLRDALLIKVPGGLSLGGSLFTLLFSGNDVLGADLSSANLAGAWLSGAFMTGAAGNVARMTSTILSGVTALDMYLPGADMTSADLSNANFSGSDFSGAHLREANLTNTNLSNADLRGADLTHANLDGARFDGAALDGATWTNGQVCASGSVGVCL